MKRTTLTMLALAVLSTGAGAQVTDRNPIQAGHGAFQVGYMKLDLSEFNAALTANGLPAADDGFLTLGGAALGGPGRWMFGGEGQALVGKSKTTTSGLYQVSMNGGYGMFRIAYNLLDNPSADLYPWIGIGGGGMQLNIRRRSAPTFNDVLATPGRSSTMTQAGFMLGASLTANYRISLPVKEADRTGGLLLGATAGYVINPARSGWKLDNINTVAGGPDAKLEGWYARFSLGGWGRGPRRR